MFKLSSFRALGEEQVVANQTISFKYFFKENPDNNIYVFAALVGVASLVNFLRAFSFFSALVRCSRHLHDAMFKSLLKAPMYFFDTNPVG